MASKGPASKGRAGALVGIGVLALVLLLDFFLDDLVADSSIRQLLMLAACNVIVALSLNVINGMAGQFSIGHAGFVGIGGYTSAILASHLHAWLGARSSSSLCASSRPRRSPGSSGWSSGCRACGSAATTSRS
jgi:ABC-type branched-subunit amino acid transport system permease subunit